MKFDITEHGWELVDEYIEWNNSDEENLENKTENNNQSKDVKIKYIYPEHFSIIEEVYENFEDENRLWLSPKTVELDAFCKYQIKEQSENATITLKTRNVYKDEKYATAAMLHKNKILIKGGDFSNWKQSIANTKLVEALGIDSYKFKIRYTDEMLGHIIPVLLLVRKAINNFDKDCDDDQIWFLAEDLLEKYHNNVIGVTLSEREKGIILNSLLGDSVFDKDIFCIRREITNKKRKFIGNKEAIKSQLQEVANKSIKRTGKYIANENVRDEKIEVSAFAAPIMATICGAYKDNPFALESVWKKKIAYIELELKGVTEDSAKHISGAFSLMEAYIEYIDKYESKESALKLEKYEIFTNKMIKNIDEGKRVIRGAEIIFQYYQAESLLGYQYVHDISSQILGYLKGESDPEMYLIKKCIRLIRLLRIVYQKFNNITRIDISNKIVDRFFKSEGNVNELYETIDGQVEEMLKDARDRERFFYEDLKEEGLLGGKKKETYQQEIEKMLCVYADNFELIQNKERDGDLRKKTNDKLNREENRLRRIKEFIIRNVIFSDDEPKIELLNP